MAIVLSLIICEDIIDLTTSDNAILGIHLLYKTDITMSDEYDSTTEDEKRSIASGLLLLNPRSQELYNVCMNKTIYAFPGCKSTRIAA